MAKRNRGGLKNLLLIIVGVVVGMMLISPAGAHLTKSLTHLFGHTDGRYYKKALSEARYVNVGEKASDSLHADDADTASFADNATNADHASTADSATNANNATNADYATTADSATNAGHATTAGDANTVDGIDSSSFFAIGRSGTTGYCDPQTTTMQSCASVSLTLPRSARVFLVAESDWNTFGTTAPVQGLCDLRVDGVSQSGTAIRAGETNLNTNNTGHYQHTGSTFVTGALGAGAHTFAFFCNQEDSDIEFRNVMISAIMLGAG